MHPARTRRRLALIASASVVLAACGQADSRNGQRTPVGAGGRDGAGASAPRATVEGYFAAVRKADGARACGWLTRELRADIERLQGSRCGRALSDEARRQPDALAGYRVARVQVRGAEATATLEGGGFEDRLMLERVAGGWLISDAPGLGG